MEEMMKNGPLVTGLSVMEDFFSYNGGVYKYIDGYY